MLPTVVSAVAIAASRKIPVLQRSEIIWRQMSPRSSRSLTDCPDLTGGRFPPSAIPLEIAQSIAYGARVCRPIAYGPARESFFAWGHLTRTLRLTKTWFAIQCVFFVLCLGGFCFFFFGGGGFFLFFCCCFFGVGGGFGVFLCFFFFLGGGGVVLGGGGCWVFFFVWGFFFFDWGLFYFFVALLEFFYFWGFFFFVLKDFGFVFLRTPRNGVVPTAGQSTQSPRLPSARVFGSYLSGRVASWCLRKLVIVNSNARTAGSSCSDFSPGCAPRYLRISQDIRVSAPVRTKRRLLEQRSSNRVS